MPFVCMCVYGTLRGTTIHHRQQVSCMSCHVVRFRQGRRHSVESVLITACGLSCLLEKKKGGIHFERTGVCLGNSRGGNGCGVCADFDLAAEAVCASLLVKMIDLLSSLPHDSIPVLLHKPASKQPLCQLMFSGEGLVCVTACMAGHFLSVQK